MSSTITATIGTNDAFQLIVTWEETSPNVTNNTSKVKIISAKVKKIKSSAHPYRQSGADGRLYVNGTQVGTTYTGGYDLDTNTEVTIFTNVESGAITHNSDGSKSVVIKFTFDGKLDEWYPNGKLEETVQLTTLDRADTFWFDDDSLSLSNTKTIHFGARGSNPHFNYHKAQIIYGGRTEETDRVNTYYTGITPSSYFAPKFPAMSRSVSAKCRVYSYSSATSASVGYTEKTITLIIPDTDTYEPFAYHSFSARSALPIAQAYCSKTGTYLQNVSEFRLRFTNTLAKFNSALSRAELLINGKTYTDNGAKSEYNVYGAITQSGTVNVTGKLIDTRGLALTKTGQITVVTWQRPQLTFDFTRDDNSVSITNISAVHGSLVPVEGVTFATPSLKLYYKVQGSSSEETEIDVGTSATSHTVSGLSKKTVYDFRMVLSDILGDVAEVSWTVKSAQIDLHMKDAHIRMGSYVDETKGPSLECDWAVYFGGDAFYIKDGNGNYIDILNKLRNLP